MTKWQNLKRIALLAMFALITTNSVTANDAGRIISIGDSLSDNGNVFALSGGISPGYPGTLSTLQRFTSPGGITWVEYLAGGQPSTTTLNAVSVMNDSLQVIGGNTSGNINLAVGGAFAGQIAGANNLGSPFLPGTLQQINIVQSLNLIQSNDIVTYWAGANNFSQLLPTATSQADIQNFGILTAGNTASDIQTLIGAGARTIVIANLPNLGDTPSNAGNPAGQQASNLATGVYNSTLKANLAQLAASNSGVQIVQLDVNTLFKEVQKNPAAFGFTNVVDACISTACALDANAQSTHLFWDGTHPTNRAHFLIAQVASAMLNPTPAAEMTAALGNTAITGRFINMGRVSEPARNYFSNISSDDDSFGSTNSAGLFDGRGYVEAFGAVGSIDQSGNVPKQDYRLGGFRAGLDLVQSETWLAGVQGSMTNSTTDQAGFGSTQTSLAADAYVGRKFGPVFAIASAGVATIDVDNIERTAVIGGLLNTGSTSGLAWNMGMELGAEFNFSDVNVVPSASVSYFDASFDGYSESGSIAPLEFSSRDVSGFVGRIGVDLEKEFAKGALFGGIGYEGVFGVDEGMFGVRAVGTLNGQFQQIRTQTPEGRGILLDVGGRYNVSEAANFSAKYELGVANHGNLSHNARARISVRF